MKAWVLFLAALAAPSVPARSIPAQAEARIDPAPPGYALRAWGPESGAPTDIRTIAQTPDGFLWLGTGNGLYRFDGLSFERIEPVAYERRRSATILTMAVASDGALWMGRDYGGVSVWRNGRLEDLPRDQQVKGAVQAITAGSQGDVWIATIGGLGPQLHLFRHGRWSLISPETGLQDESIDHLMVARDGTLWIAQGASVSRIAPGGSRPALVLRHPAYPATLAQDDEGAVWMTSAKGMERLTGGPMTRPLPSTVPAPGLFQHGGLIFADGAAWLSAYRDGLMLAPRSGPARRMSMAVTVLFRDAEGSLWGGGADGLLRLRRSDVIRVALAGAPTTGFAQGGPQGAPLYLGTDTGVVGIEAGAPRLIHRGGDMTAICAGQQGQLLAMAQTKGFVRQGGRWRYLPPPPDAAPTGSCAITSDGRILNIMGNVNIAQLDGQRWKGWQPAQNWQFGVSDGQKGLFTLRPTTSLTHLTPKGQSEIWNRDQIATGFMRMLRPFGPELYIGGEQGLARMRGGRIVTLDAHHHPWLAGITGLAMGRGRVWIISGAGIADVERGRWDAAFAHPEQPIPHRLHGDHEGIHARRDVYWAANDAEIDAEGRPWFVTNRGLVRIEPEGGAAPAPAPPVVIRSLEADGRVYRGADPALPAGTRRIQVDAVALSLIDPARNLYRYRLSGVDRDWVQTDARSITYTGLAPGRYALDVMAANADGLWSRQAARVTFTIAPYFWQTWWFAALAGLALGVAVWAGLRWRIRAATQAVRQRIEDRLAVHEQIARELHDTLLQGFQGLMLRFQSTLERLPHDHPARLELEDTLERADDVLIEGRDKVRELRAAGEPVDLAALLRALATARLEDGPVWDLRITGKPRRVCAPVADEIEAIAGEALFNARRHAQAGRIVIAVSFARDSLHLSVSDDGVGLDRAVMAQGQRPGHFGLIHMRERAAALGAKFDMGDAHPHGTVMSLTIPARIAFREVRWGF
ncbi:triple tyrosine motif-containing protein [Novosphingobium sp. SG707]|uniref:triple tyrosine motif-containing protein n=1 Tax=Novosphingobium sp. SG707 TaxID=2586996 RepID=UPI001447E26F|nr:signal transduction histidine kinase/ligand-binding sensor domain-containing protein [Novosphingobium sp. SG707]